MSEVRDSRPRVCVLCVCVCVVRVKGGGGLPRRALPARAPACMCVCTPGTSPPTACYCLPACRLLERKRGMERFTESPFSLVP